jgi:hypothetical protein
VARRRNSLQDGLNLTRHLVVGEAQHLQAARKHDPIAFCVIPVLLLMDTAVDLHDDALAVAVEVHDEAIYDLLATEVETAELVAPQALPQPPLGGSHFVS